MAAGGFRTFVASEVLDEDDINNYLMQGILVFAGSAARGSAITSPVEGQFSYLTDSDKLFYYSGSAWTEYKAGYIPATISSTTGSPGTGTFTDGNALTWSYYQFTGNGSITVGTAGYADVLVVGGGGAGKNTSSRGGGGGAGAVRWGLQYMPAATHTITIGAAGSGTASSVDANDGSTTSLGTVVSAGGGQGGIASTGGLNQLTNAAPGHGGSAGGLFINNSVTGSTPGGGAGSGAAGIALNYANSSVTYGVGGDTASVTANTGSGGPHTSDGAAGAAGVVIVRVLV